MTNTYPAFQVRSIEAISRALGDTEEGFTNSKVASVAVACRFAPEEPGTKWKRIYKLLAKDRNSLKCRAAVFNLSAMR